MTLSTGLHVASNGVQCAYTPGPPVQPVWLSCLCWWCLSETTNIAITTPNHGTDYVFLPAGWGLRFFRPFALQYGKSPKFLISIAAAVAFTVRGSHAKRNGYGLHRIILCGFFASLNGALARDVGSGWLHPNMSEARL